MLIVFLLSGCGICNLNDFTLPDDDEFIVLVQELDTPEKICAYMKKNFTYTKNAFYSPNPYQLWLHKEGDCNDLCTFAIFMANYHNYTTYQIHIYFQKTLIKHMLAVYAENNKYTYSSAKVYYPIYVPDFHWIVSHYLSIHSEYEFESYKVYDYNMNIIEQVTK